MKGAPNTPGPNEGDNFDKDLSQQLNEPSTEPQKAEERERESRLIKKFRESVLPTLDGESPEEESNQPYLTDMFLVLQLLYESEPGQQQQLVLEPEEIEIVGKEISQLFVNLPWEKLETILVIPEVWHFFEELSGTPINTKERRRIMLDTQNFTPDGKNLLFNQVLAKGSALVFGETMIEYKNDFIFETDDEKPKVYFSRGLFSKKGKYRGEIVMEVGFDQEGLVIGLELNKTIKVAEKKAKNTDKKSKGKNKSKKGKSSRILVNYKFAVAIQDPYLDTLRVASSYSAGTHFEASFDYGLEFDENEGMHRVTNITKFG